MRNGRALRLAAPSQLLCLRGAPALRLACLQFEHRHRGFSRAGDMLGYPLLNILRAPQQALGSWQAANGRKGARVARGIATDAAGRLLEILGQLFNGEQGFHQAFLSNPATNGC